MVKTYGLTHVALAVRNPARSFAFYRAVFGMKAVYREADFIQAQTPGSRDVIVFERTARRSVRGGVKHFGFRLTRPEDITKALRAVEAAGGRVLSHGEFFQGSRICFAKIRMGTKWRSGMSCRRVWIRSVALDRAGERGIGRPSTALGTIQAPHEIIGAWIGA